MKTWSALIVLLVLVSENVIQAALCSDCKCIPNAYAPTTVHCNCNPTTKILDLTHNLLSSTFANTTNFSVSDCEGSVVFHKNSFTELKDLQILNIYNVKQVTFQLGVFQHLNHLSVRNVTQLEFEPNAFNGGVMGKVEIRNSNINKFPTFSFYNIKGLTKFVLSSVNIDSVENKAIMLEGNSTIEIFNSTIDEIASKGISVEGETIVISESQIKGLQASAIDLTAKSDLIISKTEFDENLSGKSLLVSAQIMNISNNDFKNFNNDILSSVFSNPDGAVLLVNNTIHKYQSDSALEDLPNTWQVYGNQIPCSCSTIKIFNNLDPKFLQNNYCISSCQISLKMASNKCDDPSVTTLNAEDLCKSFSTMRTVDSTRGSRGINISENATMKTTGHSSGTGRLGMIPFFLIWQLPVLLL